MKMLVLCLLRIVLGCLSSTDPFQIVSAETVAEKIDRRPLALQDADNPKRHEDPTLGNDYLLAVTGQYDDYKGTLIHVSCATDTTVNVFTPYVNMTETHHISSGTQIIPLDDRLMNGKNTLAKKGVHVTADRPIAIYVIESYYDHKLYGMDGYFALPISVLSSEYIVVTDISANHTTCQFVIAALENKTIVNVTFKTTGKINIADTNYSSGDVFSLEMYRFDTFQVQHGNDLTGTFIQSNNPIAVFSGCMCGNGPVGGYCQHEVEQIVPVSSLGQEYITLPLIGAGSYRYRIIAPFNSTIASIQGQNFTIESGTFLEKWDTEPIYIQASKPVMLIEYGQCTSTYKSCINGSDPSMITIPAISTFSVNVTFGLHTNLTRNDIQYYMYVTVKTDVANKLMLDHKMINLEGSYIVKTDISGNYTILVTNITSGYHELYHPDTSVRYGAVLYGTGKDASIGFPLGYNADSFKPSVTFVSTDTRRIKLIISIVDGRAKGYKIMATSINGCKTYTRNGTFLPNETTSFYYFATRDLPGSCFSFRVVATSGSGQGTSYSAPVIEPNVCYAPSKPSITFVPTGTQNIKLRIVIVHGHATGYEIMVVSNTSGSTYTEKGTFLRNETTSVYNFTTTDLPGTCFSFRVVATSGSGQGAGYSDPVIEPNVCYESTVDLTILFAVIGVLASLLVISVLLNVYFIRKNRRIQIPQLENLQSANPVPPEDEAVTYENISPADNTRNMPEQLHLQYILPSDEQDGYLTPNMSGKHAEYDYIESI